MVDGEVVVWNGSRLDFGLLQQRMGTSPGRIGALVAAAPASYVAFDLLAVGGTDLRRRTLRVRREQLEALAGRWAPPLQLSPLTADVEEARAWFRDFRPAGVEGLVVKGASGRYAPGRREWLKVKSWETTEIIAGGVIGPIEHPSQLVAGLLRDGELVVVGRTSPLAPRQAAGAGRRPHPGRAGPPVAGPDRHRPLRRRAAVRAAHQVEPDVVVEVSADAALQAGVFRHPMRFVRVRADLQPGDLPEIS